MLSKYLLLGYLASTLDVTCGVSFVTSDVQFVKYTNISSEGTDSR